jgi:hypothetical protein
MDWLTSLFLEQISYRYVHTMRVGFFLYLNLRAVGCTRGASATLPSEVLADAMLLA